MRLLFRLNTAIVSLMTGGAIALVAFIMLGISFEVGLRAIGGGTVSGMIEGTEYALYFATFLSVPGILRTREHIRVDFLIAHASPEKRRSVEVLACIVIIAVSAVLLWYGTKMLIDRYLDGRLIFKDIVFPQWWLMWAIPLSALTTGIVALEQLAGVGSAPLAPSTPAAAETERR
jgi:TRAP-type C4-dicarboxylate transport system permease small subunit